MCHAGVPHLCWPHGPAGCRFSLGRVARKCESPVSPGQLKNGSSKTGRPAIVSKVHAEIAGEGFLHASVPTSPSGHSGANMYKKPWANGSVFFSPSKKATFKKIRTARRSSAPIFQGFLVFWNGSGGSGEKMLHPSNHSVSIVDDFRAGA